MKTAKITIWYIQVAFYYSQKWRSFTCLNGKKVCSCFVFFSSLKQGDHGCACKQCFPLLVLRPGLQPGKASTSSQLCGTGRGWKLLRLHYAGQEATIVTLDSSLPQIYFKQRCLKNMQMMVDRLLKVNKPAAVKTSTCIAWSQTVRWTLQHCCDKCPLLQKAMMYALN